MNTLPKDLEDIIIDYKTDLENLDGLTHKEIVKENLSYKIKLNKELKKDKKNFEELFFFSQKINDIKDKMIELLSDTDYCNGCEEHHCKEWDTCTKCDKQFCDEHYGDMCFTCEGCNEIFCENCGTHCDTCDSPYCKTCKGTVEDYNCESCWENSWF